MNQKKSKLLRRMARNAATMLNTTRKSMGEEELPERKMVLDERSRGIVMAAKCGGIRAVGRLTFECDPATERGMYKRLKMDEKGKTVRMTVAIIEVCLKAAFFKDYPPRASNKTAC